jgi:subtilisin family serine protease
LFLQAINWAIAKEVDIISMSFTMLTGGESGGELDTAMTNASTAGIVMLCSAHDEGPKIDTAWPASYQGANKLTIAACDEYGRLLRQMESKDYDFSIQGQQVAAGVIPFLEPIERISGSSVATALAAGLSSLILSCNWLENSEIYLAKEGNYRKARITTVKDHLKEMATKGDSQYLLLERFANIDEKSREEEEIVAELMIRSAFRKSS